MVHQHSGSSFGSYDQTTELFVSQVMAGRIETVKPRLIDAMTALGYDIIEDVPNIIGRRSSKGWGKWYSSADVLDYASILTVRLRSVGAGSTRVTFDYLIKHGWLNEGEKGIVVQEAKTIAAMSRTPSIDKMCSVCEMESTDDSRFCRNCGAPLTSESAELDVLRLKAETRAAKTSVVFSSVVLLISMLIAIVVAILSLVDSVNPKVIVVFAVFSSVGVLLSFISSLFGWNRLKRALESPKTEKLQEQRYHREFKRPLESAALHSGSPYTSITEGTTNLLDPEWLSSDERDAVYVQRTRDTKDLD